MSLTSAQALELLRSDDLLGLGFEEYSISAVSEDE